MRLALSLLGLVTVASTLTVGAPSGGSQESFFNERYCARTTGISPGSGASDCSFHTWQQCIESGVATARKIHFGAALAISRRRRVRVLGSIGKKPELELAQNPIEPSGLDPRCLP
jgi:hypothetical protein